MRFSPNVMNPVIVSCGWDKVVKVNIHLLVMGNFEFHSARCFTFTLTYSPLQKASPYETALSTLFSDRISVTHKETSC